MFPTSRDAALTRLHTFLDHAPAYASTRNHVLPGHPNVSRLSPLLRHRLLREDEVIRLTLERHSFPSVEKFLQEVAWRTYWKSWLELRPQVWDAFATDSGHLSQSPSPEARAVTTAASGITILDAFTTELIQTGYLHNHARMWFAAIWIHTLRLPWQLGAGFFQHHLLDGDPASNTLSWRWVAGLHTPGKSYLARRSNLEKFIDPSLLDPHRHSLNRIEAPEPVSLPPGDVDRSPRPLPPLPFDSSIPRSSAGLWIHEDDLSAEDSEIRQTPPQAVLVLPGQAFASHRDTSPLRRAWLQAALTDTARRASAAFHVPVEQAEAGETAALLLAWARRHGLDAIDTLAPWTGPLASEFPVIRQTLAEDGIDLRPWHRASDQTWLPLATAGFFGFWEKVRRTALFPS